MSRLLSMVVAASLLLGLSAMTRISAQDTKKDEKTPGVAPAPGQETKPVEAVSTAVEVKPIPPEVLAKIDAARRAVAEAIVAAQDAGLVDSTIEPPPILDILITGRADDRARLKAITKDTPEVGVSPEVFGAWFTGYGQAEGVVADKNIRIIPPSKGLKTWYDERNRIFSGLIAEVRKGKAPTAPEAPKVEEIKPADAPAPADALKTEEVKPADAPAPVDVPKTEEAKTADAPAPVDAPKSEETKNL